MYFAIKPQLSSYLSDAQRDLIEEGFKLITYVEKNEERFDDYSFIVFPFAKAYEGFLKQVFLDASFITKGEYTSDHFRVGKVLSPNLANKLGRKSVYHHLRYISGKDMADKVWDVWKMCRNEVFHYFPHNLKKLTFEEAGVRVNLLLSVMYDIIEDLKLIKIKQKLKIREKGI